MPAPGWYQSPADPPGRLRWWDGAQWTAEVYDAQPAGPVGQSASPTPRPMPDRTVAASTDEGPRPLPLPGTGRQYVAGEKYHQRSLRAVTRGLQLPAVTGDNWDDSVSMTAELRPDPKDRFDSHAVRVEISGQHVGYLPAEIAPGYQPLLRNLAQRGRVGTCESRLLIAPSGDICVYLHLGPPEDVAFAVYAPDNSVPLSPERIITVTGEEDHQWFLGQLAPASTTTRWATAALGFCSIARGKFAGQPAIEVRLGSERVGQLIPTMTERYQKLVGDVLAAGKTPVCRAMLSRTAAKGVQVQLLMPAVTRFASAGP